MKSFLLIFCVAIASIVEAQEYVVRVEQTFQTTNHCNDGHPYIDKMLVSFDGHTESEKQGSFEEGNYQGSSDVGDKTTYWAYQVSRNQYPNKITVYNEILGFGRKGRTWIQDKLYTNLTVGQNNLSDLNDRADCSASHTESYTLKTIIFIDCSATLDYLDGKQKRAPLVIEKGERLLLKNGNYYSNDKKPYLQVKINGVEKEDIDRSKFCYEQDENGQLWIEVNNVNITPNGQISLSYEDIVGNKTDKNSLYYKASGRTMSFRIKKMLINGKYAYSDTKEARFYHQGPDFSYNSIRQVKCLGGPGLKISVRLADPENINVYLENPSVFHWVLAHYPKAAKYDNDIMLDSNGRECETTQIYNLEATSCSVNGDMVLAGVNKDNPKFTLDNYLNEKSSEDLTNGLWLLQLQYDETNYIDLKVLKDNKELSFVSHWFKLVPPASQIVPKHEVGNYTTSDSYSIVSTFQPTINVKIEDSDYRYRMSYNIYQFGDGTSSILGNGSDSEKVSKFNKKKASSSLITTVSQPHYKTDGIYPINNLKVDKTAKQRYFYVQDHDNCIYEVKYKSVQKDFTPNINQDFNKTSGSSLCDARYSTSITYDGGAFPYSYNGKEYNPKEKITISNLRYSIFNGVVSGNNTLTLTGKDGKNETVVIHLPNFVKPSFTAVAQTCDKANGKILLATPGTFSPSKYIIGNIESANGTFENLASGTYKVVCYYSEGCSITVDVTVPAKIFSINKINDISLQDFDEKRVINIQPVNKNQLTWENNSYYNITKEGKWTLNSGIYHYKVTNYSDITKDQCTIENGFTVKAPHAQVNFKVETFAENNAVKTNITQNDITNSDEIKNSLRCFVEYNGDERPVVSQFTYSNSKMLFGADYNINKNPKRYTISEGIMPILLLGEKEDYFSEMPQPKCYNQKVVWKLKSGYEVCKKGSSDWSNQIELSQGNNEVTVRKRERRSLGSSNDFVATVDNIGYKNFSIEIETIPPISIAIKESAVSCLGYKDGSVEIVSVEPRKDGDNTYSYAIKMDDYFSNSKILKNIPSGKGTITVTDKFCKNEGSVDFSIESPSAELVVHTTVVQPDCHDDGGSIIVSANGGWNSGYYVSIERIDEQNDVKENQEVRFNHIVPDNYSIVVKDANNCKQKESATIKEYILPLISAAEPVSVSCYGYNDGKIKNIKVATNGTLNGEDVNAEKLFYVFSPKDKYPYDDAEKEMSYTDNIDNLPSGEYGLWVIDNNNCQSDTAIVHVPEPDSIAVTTYALNDGKITEKGGNDGKIRVTVDGGNAGYKYVSVGNTSSQVTTSNSYDFTGLTAGTYSVSATDSKGCMCLEPIEVSLNEPKEKLSVSISTTDAQCHARTGSVTIAVTGGWEDEGYVVDMVKEKEIRSGKGNNVKWEGLLAGEYMLHVTDSRKARLDTVVSVFAPDSLKFKYSLSPIQCSPNSGAIDVVIEGGTPGYTSFFDGQKEGLLGDTLHIDNLCKRKGGYEIRTEDSHQCQAVLKFDVEDTGLTIEDVTTQYEDDKCILTAYVRGGEAPYSYQWTSAVDSDTILSIDSSMTSKTSGVYWLSVSDSKDCNERIPVSLLLEGDRRMSVIATQRETGENRKDGWVRLHSNLVEDSDLTWILYSADQTYREVSVAAVGDGDYEINGLAGGDYSVEAVSEDGIRRFADFRIEDYEHMTVMAETPRHVSRPYAKDGILKVYVNGGIQPYNITLFKSGDEMLSVKSEDGSKSFSSLMAGEYLIQVKDSTENICKTDTIVILEPENAIRLTSEDDIAKCYNDNTASVVLRATGGWPGYRFADIKDGRYQYSHVYSGLPAEAKRFYVMDEYGVIDSVDVRLREPEELRASISAVDSVKCNGGHDGAIAFNVTGGNSNYKTIVLRDGMPYDMREDVKLEGLPSMNYVVTFTDANMCVSPDTITFFIPQPEPLTVGVTDLVNTTCEKDNGKITFEAEGGSLPYIFDWKENGLRYDGAKKAGMIRSFAEGLLQNGKYTVQVTDKNLCTTKSEEITIKASRNPVVNKVGVVDALCYGSSDGVAFVDSMDVVPGLPYSPYSLEWPQGQKAIMGVNTLHAGSYKVKIVDANKCFTTTDFTIGEPEPSSIV